MASPADTRSPDSASEQVPARKLGKYRIERQLGAGGMGTVFLAVDTDLRRTVALKVLPKERAANPQLVRRFKAEGQAAARLEHDSIVKVFEAGEIGGHLYLALEYVDGIDVQELVSKRGMLPVRRSIEIITQVAAALQHASERGIVHRDIKPSNLLIRKDGMVKLADMGLARAIDETVEAGITHAGMTVGTVDYISPEQGTDSKLADIRSDLYSLGCSWYHMLTGKVPYPDGTAIDKLRSHATARIPDPRLINDRIPGAIVAVLQRLMAKKPENRYQTPQELINDLRQPSLLMHETGAADIARLALSDSESMPRTALNSDDDSVEIFPPPAAADTRHGSKKTIDRHAAETRAAAEPPRQSKPKKAERPSAKAEPRTNRKGSEQESKPQRDLPPRSARPEKFAVSHSVIDPELLKLGVFGLIALAVVGAIGWGIWRAAQDTGPALAPSSVNPLAPAQSNAPSAAPPSVAQAQDDTPDEPPPTAALTDFRADKPFPGIDQAARDSGVADVPGWVYEVRAAEPDQQSVTSVTPEQSAADVISGLPATGGVIEFHGTGPHAIDTLTLEGRDVVLRAADGEQPILDLTQAAQGKIAVKGGKLTLDGLHIVASGRNRIRADAILSVEAATVVIRNCTITLADPASTSIPAIALARSTAGSSRCMLENVVVRGNNLSVALLEGPGQELIAGNCLFATGDAPGCMFVEPAATSLDSVNGPSSVQLLASLLMSRNSVLAGEQRNASSPPSVSFRTRHTLLLGEGSNATAIRLAPWPQSPAGDLEQPRAAGFRLGLELTQWRGWTALTEYRDLAGGDPVRIVGDADWLPFWRIPVGDHAPTGPDGQWASLHLDHQLLGTPLPAEVAAVLASSTSTAGGLNTAELPETPDSTLTRLVATSARPRVPADLEAAFIGPVITYELAKNGLKLNRLLNGPECPDGAHVILTGKKRAVMEPVLVQGKSLRIEFDGGGEPLIVEPAPRSNGERPEALIRVEQGNLDLVNARLRIPPSETSSFPLRLVQVIDGNLSLRRCVLHGQLGAGAQDTPTIDWQGGDDVERYALLEDSLVVGQSQAVGGQLRGQLLELRNSIVASGGNCLQLSAAIASRPATLALTQCTLSGAAACFRLELAASHEAPLLQAFVDQSVYGPPLVESASPVLLSESNAPSQSAGRPIVWWESQTAISDRINRPASGAAGNHDDWRSRWGTDHVSSSVVGPLAVILAAKQVELAKSLPPDFLLDPQCAAATAATGGGPLGAVIDAAHPGGPRPADEPAQPAPGIPRNRSQPNF